MNFWEMHYINFAYKILHEFCPQICQVSRSDMDPPVVESQSKAAKCIAVWLRALSSFDDVPLGGRELKIFQHFLWKNMFFICFLMLKTYVKNRKVSQVFYTSLLVETSCKKSTL